MSHTKNSVGANYNRCRGGRRSDLGEKYYRSAWEANYARYLNWLKERGEIKSWEFEPDTFEFTNIKKGTRFYTPDFKIITVDGSTEYHEVKGWMDEKSKIKIKRMKKYYPEIKLVLIGEDQYKPIARQVCHILPNWEFGKSGY